MSEQMDAQVAAWLGDVARALDGLETCDAGYGEFYISRISVGFDGDTTDIALIPADADKGFNLIIGSNE